MPYLLITLSTHFCRDNYALGHILVQRAAPAVTTEMNWALNIVMLYKWQMIHIMQRLRQQNRLKRLIFTPHVQALSVGFLPIIALGKAIYMAAIFLIDLVNISLISYVWLSQCKICKMLTWTTDELLYLSDGNLSYATALNRFSKNVSWVMESTMSRIIYCTLLRNILLTGSQLCLLLSCFLF